MTATSAAKSERFVFGFGAELMTDLSEGRAGDAERNGADDVRFVRDSRFGAVAAFISARIDLYDR